MIEESLTGTLVNSTFAITFTSVLFVFVILRWFLRRPCNFPPGPFGLPIVGYLPFLSNKPFLDLSKLSKKYGNVFSVQVGSKNVVVLCDFLAVKEAMNSDIFLDRPPDVQLQGPSENINIAVANGNLWREQRRFSVHILRNLGFGKTKMEDHIQDEINIILAHLASLDGTVCDIRKLLVPSMSNIISAFVFGRRFDYDDPTRKYLDKRATEFQDYIKQFDLKTFFPWMKPFLSLLKPKESRKFQETSEQLLSFIREETDNHKKTLDENNVRDYIDAFLMEMKERQKRNKTSSFSDNMLYGNAQVWFLGGSNPIRTAIEWCLLTIAAYPDVQKRVQTEIDSVIGRERSPCWADHVFLPYTQAVLYEVQRWQTVNPLGILRYTREDTTVQGYNIPKETIVMNNIWAVHHDPRYWKNPGEFFPEHFLSQDGATVVKPEHFIPFSMGKRSCPGEKLTNIGMFLCFVSILQHFTLALPAGERPNFDGVFELSWDTKFHHIVFLSR